MNFLTTVAHFNWFDFTIVGLILVSVLISLVRGFVRESISLLTWLIAFGVAYKFCNPLGNLFLNYIKTPSIRVVIGFIILFVLILILGGVINFLISELVSKTGLSGTDRALGMIFGFGRGVVLVAILLLLGNMTSFSHEEWWKNSVLIPHFKGVANWLQQYMPQKLS
jgi:membrane protein required for colicin V production